MKRMISMLLVFAMVIGMLPMTAWASEGEKAELQAVSAEGSCGENLTWIFEESTGTLTISGEGEMTNHESDDGVPWYDNRDIILHVIIGDNVTTIGDYAFYFCQSLVSVTIPDSVTTIGNYAFDSCSSMTNVTIPESVTTIGYQAFYGCGSLTSVTIPSSVTTIGGSAFAGCKNLIGICVEEDNPKYSSDAAGVLFDKDKTKLIQAPGTISGSYVIPDSVISIDSCAFWRCYNLISMTIRDSVTSIGSYAFAFCDSLTSVTIPDSVTSIGLCAFDMCTSLTSVTIPDSVTYIGSNAFSCCDSLSGIFVEEGNPTYSSDATGVLFNKDQTELIQAPGAISGSYVIPDSVTTIDDHAFYYCKSLISVTIPGSVTTISEPTFYNCSSLISVTIPGSVTSIGDDAFGACMRLTDVYYAGSEAEWASITIGSKNECLTNATIHFECDEDNTDDPSQPTVPCQHSYVAVVTAPTCEDQGYTTYTCNTCGDCYVGDYVAATGHSMRAVEEKAPTCTDQGCATYICDTCGYSYTESYAAIGHNYANGSCSVCGDRDPDYVEDDIITEGTAGTGTAEDPFQITTAEEWENISIDPSAHYVLMNDITLSSDTNLATFAGVLDGRDNLITLNNGDCLIDKIEESGIVQNLHIKINIESLYRKDTFGSLCKTNYGTIRNCVVSGSLCEITEYRGTSLIVGGICGYNSGTITNCKNEADIIVENDSSTSGVMLEYCRVYAGGIVGQTEGGNVKNCWNSGRITVDISDHGSGLAYSSYAGGIAGKGPVDNCANSGSILLDYTPMSGGYHDMYVGYISGGEARVFYDSKPVIIDDWTKNSIVSNNCSAILSYDSYWHSIDAQEIPHTVVTYEELVEWWIGLNETEKPPIEPDSGQTANSVRYFREWVPERQVVCWGKESDNVFYYESLVTEESDRSFLNHLDELVGNYVLVETKENDQGLVGVDVVLSIKPLDAVDIGVVTAISTTDRTITIEGTTYAYTCEFVEEVPKTGNYVRYCVYEGKIVSVVILESSSNESIRYFTNWDEPSQTATFGRDVQSMVKATDDTDKSFLNDLDNLLGKYVLVECITIDGVTELVSIKSVETKFGKVTAIDGASVTIDGTKYEDSGWSLLCGVSVDDRILCHFYEGTVIAVEILQIHTGKLMGWNKNSREVSIALDNEPDLGALGYSLSVLATNDSVELLNRLSSGSTTIVTEIWFVCDAQGFVYYISDSEPPEVDPGQQPDDIPEFDKPNYDNSESDIEVLKGYIFEYLEEFERYYNSPKKESDKTFAAAVENAILNDAEISAEKVKEEAIEKSAKKMKSDDDGNSDKLISGEDGSTGFRDIAYKALATHYYEVVSNKTPNISDIDISDYAGTTKLIREIISNLSSSSHYYKIDNELVFVSISDAFGAKMGQIQISGITFFVNSTRTMCEAAIKDYLIEMEELAKNEAWGIVNDLSSEILSKPLSTLTENSIKKYIKNFAKKFDMEIDEFLTKCGLADLPDILNNFCSFYDFAKKIEKAANSQDIVSAVNNIKNIDIKDIKFNDKVVDGCYKKLKGIINKIIDELENYQKEGSSEKKSVFNLNFNCPIEIAVYSADGSQQIGFVGEEEVWHNNSIAIQTHGKVKGIQVFSDEIPTFVITATDLGTMNCSVEERNDENEPIGRILFYDIPLTANETYELKLKKDLQSNRDSIAFETDNNTFYADKYITGGDRRAVSISCNVESAEAGDIYGTGTYACGDVARLYARAKEGFVFVGWYDGEELVNDSLIYEFITKEDRSLTAKFAANNTVYINIINGEGGSSIGEGTVEKNQPVTVIAFARHGYAFEGWYLNEQLVSNEIEYNFIAVEDITLEVRFVNHTHDYSVPDFVWSEDFSCYSVISCLSCTYETHIECDISKETIPATETETGENIYTATVGFNGVSYTDTKTEIIPATGHTSHTAGNEWLSDKTNHWHVCTGCDEIMDLSAHSGGTATCAEAAVCTVCGTSYGKTNSDNHTGETEIRNAKDATAYEDGYTGDTYCLDCGGIIALGKKIPALTTVQRISGKDRVKTALSVAKALKDTLKVDKFDAVIIATGVNEKFADALTGSYLANRKKAPILLYTNSGLSQLNVSFIQENLKTNGTVYILGGDSAVPTTVEQTLTAYNVVRLSGKTRYETNLAILKEAGISGNEILVATGTNFADSLSASAVGLPLLLVNGKNTAPNAVQTEFLKSVAGKKITIIGGDGAVSEEMKAAIEAITGVTAERISGKTRHDTSVLIAQKYFNNPEYALITYAKNFPDGLAGGPLAYAMGAPLLLTSAGQESIANKYITSEGIDKGFVLGGDSAVSDETARKVFGLAADAAIEKAYYTE